MGPLQSKGVSLLLKEEGRQQEERGSQSELDEGVWDEKVLQG